LNKGETKPWEGSEDGFMSNRVHLQSRGGGGIEDKSENKGLISVDRSTRLLYYLQYPVLHKSYTRDFSPPIFGISIQDTRTTALPLPPDPR
jgi:hypothetical protein